MYACVRRSTNVNVQADVGQDTALGPAEMSNAEATAHMRIARKKQHACVCRLSLLQHVTDSLLEGTSRHVQ